GNKAYLAEYQDFNGSPVAFGGSKGYITGKSPVVSTTFVEQFWMSAKSKLINNVRYITAKVAGKPVSISEASIRSDLLFDDVDGIDSLTNQAIFDAIQLMGPSPTTHITDSIPEGSGGNHEGQLSSDRSLSRNEGGMTLQSVYDLYISLCTQGKKSAKAKPTVHKDPAFDELGDDATDNMETEDAQDVGRTRYLVHEEKEREEKEVSTEDALGTDKEKVSTDIKDKGIDMQKVSTDKEEVSTDRPDEGIVDQTEGRSSTPTTPTPTPTTFGDDETIAQVLLNM
ncbi:hypothetical protein Tco_1526847, partial [Tanacetum coccineum]